MLDTCCNIVDTFTLLIYDVEMIHASHASL